MGRIHADVYLASGLKRCARCKEPKDSSVFGADPRNPERLLPYCPDCRRARMRDYRKDNRETLNRRERTTYAARRRDSHLRRLYGITHERYQEILAEQDRKCAICGSGKPGGRWPRFHVDHCHTTKAIRGLLCTRCNQMIGYADDNPEIMRKAADYLMEVLG